MIEHRVDNPRLGLVLLHGRGSNGRQILSLLDYAGVSDVAAVAPEAPGNSWWPTSFLAPMAQMQRPLDAALDAVDAGVRNLRALGLSYDRIWLAGFSQGAVLSLEYYARFGHGLAGAFGFSGGLIGVQDQGERSDALYGHADKRLDYAGPVGGKVWMSVHEKDPHIPLKRVHDSAEAFRGLGAEVRVQTYPGAGHQILPPDVAILNEWLA